MEEQDNLEQKQEEKKEMSLGKKLMIRNILIGLCISIISVGMFLVGGIYTCSKGGGTLAGLECKNIEVTEVCLYEGELYKPPSEVPLYKELLPNGSLSKEIYTRNDGNDLVKAEVTAEWV